MKYSFLFLLVSSILFSVYSHAQPKNDYQKSGKHIFIDVHYLPGGKVNFADVAGAHAKDLATQQKYGVEFIKYWVDESKGVVYCLAAASDSAHLRQTHAEAHGLLPAQIFEVTDGPEAKEKNAGNYFIDVHEFGEGKVTAGDVAKAHEKDLATQKKFGVNFINYWVDEKKGVVICLSQAKDASNVIETHKAAHGLIPQSIEAVKQGQ